MAGMSEFVFSRIAPEQVSKTWAISKNLYLCGQHSSISEPGNVLKDILSGKILCYKAEQNGRLRIIITMEVRTDQAGKLFLTLRTFNPSFDKVHDGTSPLDVCKQALTFMKKEAELFRCGRIVIVSAAEPWQQDMLACLKAETQTMYYWSV